MKTPKFNNRYRIASARAEWWDYGEDAAYFFTICTRGRAHFFGEIRNGKMHLSPIGAVANVIWHQIPQHFPDWELDEFVVMPNHIHGVLIKNSGDAPGGDDGNSGNSGNSGNPGNSGNSGTVQTGGDGGTVQTGHALSLPPAMDGPHPRLRNPGKNTLSTVIGSFKSAVTRHVRRMGFDFGWQPRFHDHIIRDAGEFGRITTYIANNVAKWDADKFHS